MTARQESCIPCRTHLGKQNTTKAQSSNKHLGSRAQNKFIVLSNFNPSVLICKVQDTLQLFECPWFSQIHIPSHPVPGLCFFYWQLEQPNSNYCFMHCSPSQHKQWMRSLWKMIAQNLTQIQLIECLKTKLPTYCKNTLVSWFRAMSFTILYTHNSSHTFWLTHHSLCLGLHFFRHFLMDHDVTFGCRFFWTMDHSRL